MYSCLLFESHSATPLLEHLASNKACCFIRGKMAFSHLLIDLCNKVGVFTARTSRIKGAKGVFLGVEYVTFWRDDEDKVISEVLHGSAFLDTLALKCLNSR